MAQILDQCNKGHDGNARQTKEGLVDAGLLGDAAQGATHPDALACVVAS